MKRISWAIFLIFIALTSHGQSLFFDNLDNSTWTSSVDLSESILKTKKEISLLELVHPKDSINRDVTIWTFKRSVLIITKYNYLTKDESIVGTYKYDVLQGKSVLQITSRDNLVLKYKVGIVSTGHYAVLLREKGKNGAKKLKGQTGP